MIDIGVNLTHPSLLNTLEENIYAWQQAGISHIIAIASDLDEGKQIKQLSEAHPSIYHTLGCHPHHADSWHRNSLKELKALFSLSHKAIAIGEAGLDFNRNYSTQDNQINAFEEQISLAKDIKIPLYLHEREAQEQVLSLLKNGLGNQVNGVLHCFTSDKASLQKYLDLGLYIGITGWICDERRGQELQDAVRYIPQDRILIETDAPYLLPRTLRPRPKKNHPKYLAHIAEQIAIHAGLTTEKLIQLSRDNTRTLFNLKEVTK